MLYEEAQRCFRAADSTADNKAGVALLAYASELEQRVRLIESARRTGRACILVENKLWITSCEL